METLDPQAAISGAEERRKAAQQRAPTAAEWFFDHSGGLVSRSTAVSELCDAHGWETSAAQAAVTAVVGDRVDPVQQIHHPDRGPLVGVIDFPEVTEAKILLYNTDYSIGVSSSELTLASEGDLTFRNGGHSGTRRAEIDGTTGDLDIEGQLTESAAL